MNWDDLKFFLAVCREQNIRAAAIYLKCNHATVSRRIKKFEEQFDQLLFDRTGKGYQLTRLGEEVLEQASLLEVSLNNLSRKTVAKDRQLKGGIKITMPELFAENLLMPHFTEF